MFGFNPNHLDYNLISELAPCCNGIGTVYIAQHKPTYELIAVKKFKMGKETEESVIKEEVLTMRQFNHSNLLSFHTAFVHNFELYLVEPIMCYCSCRHVINRCFATGFSEILVSLILKDVLQGLEYLHKKGFVHRSIRASHILINQTKAVLSGFRECTSMLSHGERVKKLHDMPPKSTKSLNWLAPEVLEQNLLGYTEKSDVYSIGITTCELANGVEPFSDMHTTLMLTEKIRGNQPALLDQSTCPEDVLVQQTVGDSGVGDNLAAMQSRHYSHRKLSDPFHKFAEICMQRHPIDRPSVAQLLNHNFFKQTKHVSLYDQFLSCGIQAIDCTKTKDESMHIVGDFGDMSIGESFEWNFN